MEKQETKEPIESNASRWMDIGEFRELGFLQEANRQFFHPHGLALAVSIDEATGKMAICGVWDYRDDPEGIVYTGEAMAESDTKPKADSVAAELEKHRAAREALFGSVVQPIK